MAGQDYPTLEVQVTGSGQAGTRDTRVAPETESDCRGRVTVATAKALSCEKHTGDLGYNQCSRFVSRYWAEQPGFM